MPARPDDDPPPAAAGRHTLGSSYDPPTAPEPAPPGAEPTQDAEPRAETGPVHGDAWRAALERLATLDGPARALCTAVLEHVEAGWPPLLELKQLHARNRVRAHQRDALGHVLSFIDSDLVDLYYCVASEAGYLVPLPGETIADMDPCDLDGYAESFNRYLALLSMAVADAGVTDGVRQQVRRVARELEGWYVGLRVLLRRIDAAIGRPPSENDDEPDELAA